jgi:hypothetical protein
MTLRNGGMEKERWSEAWKGGGEDGKGEGDRGGKMKEVIQR